MALSSAIFTNLPARGWRIGVALVVVIASGAVVGCSSSSPHRQIESRCPSQAPRVVSAGYLEGVQQSISVASFLDAVPRARGLSTARAMLVGPHSSIVLDAIAITNRIGASTGCALGLPRPISAQAGHQLIVFRIGNTPALMGLPECFQVSLPTCENLPDPTIVIAGRSRPLPAGPVFVASVPARATVALQLNDGGRPQDLDLRTGTRIREASPPSTRF